MIKPITTSTIVFLFLLTTTIQASDNPIPFDEAAAKAQAREQKAKILQQQEQTKDLYASRASEFPDMQEKIKEQLRKKLQNPMMKLQTLSTENLEKIEASRAYLKSTTVKLPENEEEKYATPYN